MKRPFRGFEVVGLAAVLAGGACAPSNAVKSGAPVLIEVSIVEGGGASITSIPAGAAACAAGTASGGTCYTTGDHADKTCFLAQNWCRCASEPAATMPMPAPTCTDGGMAGMSGAAGGAGGAAGGAAGGTAGADAGTPADAAPPPDGIWNCDPFAPTAQALFTFDRVIDTRPFDSDAGVSAAATVTAGTPAAPVASTTVYTPNGTPHALFSPSLHGPNLLVSPTPALPASSTAIFQLNPTAVHAKDGRTLFTDNGNFAGGMLTFTTAPFSASVTPPAPPPLPADAGACATPNTDVALDAPATITFNSPVDPLALIGAVTVTVAGSSAPVAVTLASMDGLHVTVAPMDKWPANADITITVDATAADLAGDLLGAPVTSDKFHTGAL